MNRKQMHIKTFVKSVDDFIELEATIKRASGDIIGVKSTPAGLLEVDYTI